jgi:hypothetical protein
VVGGRGVVGRLAAAALLTVVTVLLTVVIVTPGRAVLPGPHRLGSRPRRPEPARALASAGVLCPRLRGPE